MLRKFQENCNMMYEFNLEEIQMLADEAGVSEGIAERALYKSAARHSLVYESFEKEDWEAEDYEIFDVFHNDAVKIAKTLSVW